MKLSKQIVNGFVSWIDLKDVQEYIQQLEKVTIKKKIFSSFLIINNINKIKNLDLCNFERGDDKTQMIIFSKYKRIFKSQKII